jgi:hypothetical protein
MKHAITDETYAAEQESEILAAATLKFEENVGVDGVDDCPDYGCTCIAHEKCCGCLVQ